MLAQVCPLVISILLVLVLAGNSARFQILHSYTLLLKSPVLMRSCYSRSPALETGWIGYDLVPMQAALQLFECIMYKKVGRFNHMPRRVSGNTKYNCLFALMSDLRSQSYHSPLNISSISLMVPRALLDDRLAA